MSSQDESKVSSPSKVQEQARPAAASPAVAASPAAATSPAPASPTTASSPAAAASPAPASPTTASSPAAESAPSTNAGDGGSRKTIQLAADKTPPPEIINMLASIMGVPADQVDILQYHVTAPPSEEASKKESDDAESKSKKEAVDKMLPVLQEQLKRVLGTQHVPLPILRVMAEDALKRLPKSKIAESIITRLMGEHPRNVVMVGMQHTTSAAVNDNLFNVVATVAIGPKRAKQVKLMVGLTRDEAMDCCVQLREALNGEQLVPSHIQMSLVKGLLRGLQEEKEAVTPEKLASLEKVVEVLSHWYAGVHEMGKAYALLGGPFVEFSGTTRFELDSSRFKHLVAFTLSASWNGHKSLLFVDNDAFKVNKMAVKVQEVRTSTITSFNEFMDASTKTINELTALLKTHLVKKYGAATDKTTPSSLGSDLLAFVKALGVSIPSMPPSEAPDKSDTNEKTQDKSQAESDTSEQQD